MPLLEPGIFRYPKLIHIPQIHPATAPFCLTEIETTAVLDSQLRIAKFFWNKPSATVFVEGVTEDLLEERREAYLKSRPRLTSFIEAFQSGLPTKKEELSYEQRHILANNMAVPTLWVLGRLRNVYATGDRPAQLNLISTGEALIEQVAPGMAEAISLDDAARIHSAVFIEREKLAMAQIDKFLRTKTDSPKEIYIVFGALHDFGRSVKRASGF